MAKRIPYRSEDEYWAKRAKKAEKEGYIGVEESEKFINKKLNAKEPKPLKEKK